MRKRGHEWREIGKILPLYLSSHSRGEDELEQWIEPVCRLSVCLISVSVALVLV